MVHVASTIDFYDQFSDVISQLHQSGAGVELGEPTEDRSFPHQVWYRAPIIIKKGDKETEVRACLVHGNCQRRLIETQSSNRKILLSSIRVNSMWAEDPPEIPLIEYLHALQII